MRCVSVLLRARREVSVAAWADGLDGAVAGHCAPETFFVVCGLLAGFAHLATFGSIGGLDVGLVVNEAQVADEDAALVVNDSWVGDFVHAKVAVESLGCIETASGFAREHG